MRARTWNNQLKLLLAALLVMPLLSGCWDRIEIEERAVILGIAIDAAEENGESQEEEVSHLRGSGTFPHREMIRLTAQLAVPGRISLGPGESGGGKGGAGGKESVWVLSVAGHTVDEAVSN